MDHLLELFLFVTAAKSNSSDHFFCWQVISRSFGFAVGLQVSSQVSISPGPIPTFKPPSCAYQGQYLAAYLTSYIHSEKGHTFTVSSYCWNIPQHIIYDPELHKNNSQHDNAHINKLVPAYPQCQERPCEILVSSINVSFKK